MRRAGMTLLPLVACLLIFPVPAGAEKSTQTDRYGAAVAVAWFDLLYDVIKAENLSPPVAARVYGIAGVTLYEAVVPGARHNRSLVGQVSGLSSLPGPRRGKTYHWPAVANSAQAAVIRQLLPGASATSLTALETLEQHFASSFRLSLPRHDFTRSVTQGQEIAEAAADWAATDGYATYHTCPFTPPVGPGLWVPTPPAFTAHPLKPCWGQLAPLVLIDGAECAPPAPPPYSEAPTSELFQDAKEGYATDTTLTPEQRTVAQYWADGPGTTGTSAGHWIAIVGQVVAASRVSLIMAAEAYARVGIAVADAFIAAWYTKYQYNLLRPVIYVRAVIDPAWTPLLVTPPFPEYTSGHSVQLGAAATVLTDMFGEQAFTDTTHTDHGLVPVLAPRTFPSFQAEAAEAALSRLYGGIHFRSAIERGLRQGTCVGQKVLERVHFRKEVSGAAEVVFLAGHGMGTKYRAQFLSDQILLRLGVAAPVQPEASQELAQSVIWRGRIDPVVGWGGRHLPETVQKTLTPLDRGMRAWGVSILDFAPTLSTLLGVELSDASSPS